jgi:hypothetical protein
LHDLINPRWCASSGTIEEITTPVSFAGLGGQPALLRLIIFRENVLSIDTQIEVRVPLGVTVGRLRYRLPCLIQPVVLRLPCNPHQGREDHGPNSSDTRAGLCFPARQKAVNVPSHSRGGVRSAIAERGGTANWSWSAVAPSADSHQKTCFFVLSFSIARSLNTVTVDA